MQTLFGIRITDRAKVVKANGQFLGYFDDVHVCTSSSGERAVLEIRDYVKEQTAARIIAERERREEYNRQLAEAEQRDIDRLKENVRQTLNCSSEAVDDIAALVVVLAAKMIKDAKAEE